MSVQLGLLRMPTMVGEPGQMPFRPRICLWVDQSSGMVLHFQLQEQPGDPIRFTLESIVELANRIHGLPRQIQTREPNLAMALRPALADLGVEVIVRESLPMLDEAFESLGNFKDLGVKPEPSVLQSPGMTLDRLIAFAEAAKLFYEARPWWQLVDDDLIEIESPAGPKGTRFAQMLGAGGREFGLGFVATRKVHEDMQAGLGVPRGGLWSLLFDELDYLPFDDGQAWERHNLPVAHARAYPNFKKFMTSRPQGVLPTADELEWAEGLLRALAATSEDELDSGRWTKDVQTASGPRTYQLSLPILLEEMAGGSAPNPNAVITSGRMAMERMMRGIAQQVAEQGATSEADINRILKGVTAGAQLPEFKPTTPTEQAMELAYQAHDARGRRKVQLARQALAIDPDCCEALLILAGRNTDPEFALPRLRRATEAGERQLGPEVFAEDAGHFWMITETRPYMRARGTLAATLMRIEQYDEAIVHFQELLRLNPGDNQGNRYMLAQCLLYTNRLDELDELLNRAEYKDEFSAEWAYTRTLLSYRRGGDSPEARQQLLEAHRTNPNVVSLLTGKAKMRPGPPMPYSPGDMNEAVNCVMQLGAAWDETDGAIEWLQTVTAPLEKRTQPSHGEGERQKKDKKKRR
ncbi:MAG TPA: tetratricopeptide repeat protein [Tepidisphaeraceae bacterium]|nr:tetratricopeptide repeat protein [Tepidisphaeraceae bacterium]